MDAITIERARRGDRSAQAMLLRRLQDRWFRLCRSLLGQDDAAREATQETAMRFLRDLPRFRGDSSVATWSMGIAINVAREMRRRSEPDRAGAQRELRAACSPPPDDAAMRSEETEILHSMLRALSDRQREAIVLRFFEDLSLEETAGAMNCAVGTVKATIHQALRALRAKLKQLT